MKSRRIVLAGVLLLVVAGAGGWLVHATGVRNRIAAALPPEPDTSAVAPLLREKIQRADAGARSVWRPQRGLVELSRLYHVNGYLDEAQRCYAMLEQLDPAEPRWPHLHATILAGYGEIEPALALWRRVAQLAPTYVPAQLRIADCELKQNQSSAATRTYQAVLQRAPDNAYALLGLARIDYEAGRWEKARERLEPLVAQTNYQLGYDLIVTVYERLHQPERAAAIRGASRASGAYRDPPDPWLDQLIDDCYDPYRLSLTAGVRARTGDPAGAIALLQRALELTPGDASVHFQLGDIYADQGDLAAAREQYERCTVLSPGFSDGWGRLSSIYTKLQDDATADRILTAGLEHCPQSPGLHLMRARQFAAASRLGEAIGEYRTSITLRPNEPDAYIELGILLAKAGRTAEAVEQFQGALEADPGEPQALDILAFNAISTGDKPAAQRWMARVVQQPRVPADRVERLQQLYRQQFSEAP